MYFGLDGKLFGLLKIVAPLQMLHVDFSLFDRGYHVRHLEPGHSP